MKHIIISILVNGVLGFLKQPKKAEKGKVYLPKFFLVFGIVISTIFLIPTFITVFVDAPILVQIIFFAFSLLGASFIVAFVNCRVSYDADGFIAKNFFGIKRNFTYDQVTAIKENMHEDYLYIGKHKVTIDEFSVGGKEFIAHVKKRYRTIHNGQALPKVHKTKHDIFNGNVEDVPGFMFAYISVSVLIVAIAIFFVWFIYLNPSTVANTVEQQVTFTSCITDGDEIVLTSSDNKLYKIIFIGDGFDSTEIKAICDGKTVVTAYSKEMTPKHEEDYYSIKAMIREDTYLLSFDETNRWHREEYWPLIFFPVIYAALWGAFIAVSIIVGRNPQKFSKKVVNLFFRKGYVKY